MRKIKMEDWYNPGKKYISNRYVVLFYLNNIYFWTWALKKIVVIYLLETQYQIIKRV